VLTLTCGRSVGSLRCRAGRGAVLAGDRCELTAHEAPNRAHMAPPPSEADRSMSPQCESGEGNR